MKKLFFSLLLATSFMMANAQCRYCNTYEDYMNGKWEQLDTIYSTSHSKNDQMWWGGNDYAFTTNDKEMDKILKKQAFAVMIADTLYINCRNLRFENTRFGNGYTKAKHIGRRSLLFVNRIIGEFAQSDVNVARYFFGVFGSVAALQSQMKQQVCYVIYDGADKKGRIAIRLIDDALMEQMIIARSDLRQKYLSERDKAKRLLASHVLPILEESGLFEQYQR